MPTLATLLEVQELDLKADGLRAKRRDLPERTALVASREKAKALDQAHAALDEQREQLRSSERNLGGEVSMLAEKATEANDTLYSGSVKASKELQALQEEVRLLKEKQAALEDEELVVMEQIEGVSEEMAANRSQREACDAEGARLEAAIAAAEKEIDGELAQLEGDRGIACEGIAGPVLVRYAALREKTQLLGRAAAALTDGSCQGCRVRLPVVENRRMLDEPPEALLTCPRCSRILVR